MRRSLLGCGAARVSRRSDTSGGAAPSGSTGVLRVFATEGEPLRAQAEAGHAVCHVFLQGVEETHFRRVCKCNVVFLFRLSLQFMSQLLRRSRTSSSSPVRVLGWLLLGSWGPRCRDTRDLQASILRGTNRISSTGIVKGNPPILATFSVLRRGVVSICSHGHLRLLLGFFPRVF